MPTDTPSKSLERPFAEVPARFLEASRQAVSASAALYLDGLQTVAMVQRRLAAGTPLEPLSDVVSHQADAAREVVQAYLSAGEQVVREGRSTAEVADEAATRVVRGTAGAARKATRRSGRAVRQAATRAKAPKTAPVTKAAEPPKAVEAPIADYDAMTADELIAKLPEASQSTLAQVAAYEKANASRATVLDRVAALTGPEPVPGYDDLSVDEVQKLVADGDEALATAVRDYERRHKGRAGVIEATKRQTSGS
jgi:hypothetical protein